MSIKRVVATAVVGAALALPLGIAGAGVAAAEETPGTGSSEGSGDLLKQLVDLLSSMSAEAPGTTN